MISIKATEPNLIKNVMHYMTTPGIVREETKLAMLFSNTNPVPAGSLIKVTFPDAINLEPFY